jgi:polysaccharide biosynthesis transport protein
MAIQDYLRVVAKWWWLLVLATLVAAGSSYYSVSRAPRIYQATTTIIVGQSLSRSNPSYQDFAIGQQLAQTYVNMVQREPILNGAAQAIGLDYVPWRGNVNAVIILGTQLVEIHVRDTSPQRAQALANGIANQLILQTPDDAAGSQTRRAFIEGQLQALERNIAAAEAEISDLQARLAAASSARAIQQHQDAIDVQQQRLGRYQTSYASLLSSADGGVNYISIIEPAGLPTRPVSPNVMQTVALAAVMGMALAAGGAILIEFLDNTVKTSEDVMLLTKLPTLGTITSMQGTTYRTKLPSAYVPQSPITESFRALRTNIQYCAVNRQLHTVLLTSPSPAEGKSFILANLAIVMAQSGLSVLLVDADLRRPVQHRIFGLDREYGLSNALLEADVDLDKYIHLPDPKAENKMDDSDAANAEAKHPFILGHGSLRIMTAGPPPPNPADLLSSQRMQDLINRLVKQADIVLFDTPPALAVTDAAVLTRMVDGVLLVVDVGHSKRIALRHATERLSQVDANLVGVIMNRASSSEAGYYAYHYTPLGERPARRWPLNLGRIKGQPGPLRSRLLMRLQDGENGHHEDSAHLEPATVAAGLVTESTLDQARDDRHESTATAVDITEDLDGDQPQSDVNRGALFDGKDGREVESPTTFQDRVV